MITNEPVRGRIAPPWFASLSGLERIQALSNRYISTPPFLRLFGLKLGHVTPGYCAWTMPASAWLSVEPGFVDICGLAITATESAAMTMLPPGFDIRPILLSSFPIRPAVPGRGHLVARARVLHTSSFFILVSFEIEDSSGRSTAMGMARFRIESVDPAPPPPPAKLTRVEDPVYESKDPIQRPLTERSSGRSRNDPFTEFLDAATTQHTSGLFESMLQPSEWHCCFHPTVSAGFIASLCANIATSIAYRNLPEGTSFSGLEQSIHFYRPVAVDGSALRCSVDPYIRDTGTPVLVIDGSLTNARGELIAMVAGLGVEIPAGERRSRNEPQAKRILATLLFSDIVGSTDHIAKLGDAGWRELRDQHHQAIRALLIEFGGTEVDTAGDGFLVRFESPASSLEYARSIRDAVTPLGLQLRIGIHTGECELKGREVIGMAVHVAARLQGAADPGEIICSEIVKSLALGSEHAFHSRGPRELKGVPGTWELFALSD